MQEIESKERKFAAEERTQMRNKQKKLRLERLEGWGEQNDNYEEEPLPEGWRVSLNHKDISIEETGFIVNPEKEKKQANIPEGWMKDKDNKDKHDTSNKTNTNISKPIETEEVPQLRKGKNPPSKVKIKKRGRLEEREMVEIKKTNTSMMSWLVGKVSKPTQVQLEPEPEEMDWEDRDREEKLARVERKKLEWASTKLSRSVLLDMANDMVSFVENKHLVRMMSEVVDEA